MHSYLRAIGFSKLKKETEIDELLEDVFRNYENKNAVKMEDKIFLEMEKEYASNMGILLCGELDQNGFHRKQYIPYFKGSGITTREDIIVERKVSGDAFAGVCEDGRIGVSLIFYVQNTAEYMKEQFMNQLFGRQTSLVFSGLASTGMILLPVQKKNTGTEKKRMSTFNRNQLMNAAKNGDPDAIESLTIEDMDLYSMISRRVYKEDIYSIVDTFFMPYGVECDQYQIMGEIKYYTKVKNSFTGESVYQMTLVCNDMEFDVCINEMDLMGDPDIGRRFKGNIWLQGKINFE